MGQSKLVTHPSCTSFECRNLIKVEGNTNIGTGRLVMPSCNENVVVFVSANGWGMASLEVVLAWLGLGIFNKMNINQGGLL